MAVEWIEPKTDWVSSDYINYSDVNRIVNNLKFLHRFSHGFLRINYQKMPEIKDYTEYPYADELNAIEDNLDNLNLVSYNFNIGYKQTFKANGVGWNYAELNRIEQAELRLYERMKYDRIPLNMMKFTLGKQRGFRQ